MTDDECVHGFADPLRTCAICRRTPHAPMAAGVIVAQYRGRCVDCGDGIDVGDPIRPAEDGYVHEECA